MWGSWALLCHSLGVLSQFLGWGEQGKGKGQIPRGETEKGKGERRAGARERSRGMLGGAGARTVNVIYQEQQEGRRSEGRFRGLPGPPGTRRLRLPGRS